MEINKPVSITILLVIAVIIAYLFVLPKYTESKDLEIELFKKQAQYEGRVDYYVKLSEVLHTVEQKQDSLSKIDSALPFDFAVSPVVNYLQITAKESRLVVNSINFSQQGVNQALPENYSTQINIISFRADLTGSYQGLKSFLVSLEKSARLFEVNSISFNNGQLSKGKANMYNFSLEIETHSY